MRVREFVAQKVRSASRGHLAICDGESILLSGLLNSVTMVEIILFVEQEFGLDITTDNIQIEDFDTVDSICALLDKTCPLVRRENLCAPRSRGR